jgi:hypothetical protein
MTPEEVERDVKAIIHDMGHGGQVCQYGENCDGPEFADMIWAALARDGYAVTKLPQPEYLPDEVW